MNETELDLGKVRSDFFLALLEMEPASTVLLRRKRIAKEIARLVRGTTLFAESEGFADQARDDIAGLKARLERIGDEYLGVFEQSANTRRAILALAREVPLLAKLEVGFQALAREAEGMIEFKSPEIVAKALELLMNKKLGEVIGSLYPLGDSSEPAAGRRPAEVGRRMKLLNRLRDYYLEEYWESSLA